MPLETNPNSKILGYAPASGKDNNENRDIHIAQLKKGIAHYELARADAAESEDHDKYRQATNGLEWYREQLLNMEAKQGKTEVPAPNILKQAGEQFNNLK